MEVELKNERDGGGIGEGGGLNQSTVHLSFVSLMCTVTVHNDTKVRKVRPS